MWEYKVESICIDFELSKDYNINLAEAIQLKGEGGWTAFSVIKEEVAFSNYDNYIVFYKKQLL